MVTGHFGFAAGVKSQEQFVPLWALMLASVWLDILFIPLLAVGAESIDDVPGTDGGYGEVIIHADYTHSFVGAIVISLVTGWIVMRWWGQRGGIVIGAVVFSHWVLDLIVHRHDMPLLPGNVGDVRVGFGLWKVEWASILTEAAILVVGAYLYWRAAQKVERASGVANGRASLVGGLLVLFGAVVLALDVAVGQVDALKGANLALRFALELAALAAVGWWGWDVGGPLLALAAVAAVVVVWGAFVAPKRRFDLAAPIRLAIELAVWLAAGAALYGVGHTALAVAFVVLAVVSGALNHLWQ